MGYRNQQDNEGNTGLHMALMGRSLELAKILIVRDVNPLIENSISRTPLDLLQPEEIALMMHKYDHDKDERRSSTSLLPIPGFTYISLFMNQFKLISTSKIDNPSVKISLHTKKRNDMETPKISNN